MADANNQSRFLNAKCEEHSGCLKSIENLEKNNAVQWEALSKMQDTLDKVRNRLPTWATCVISLLTFLLGCAITWCSKK